MIEIVQISPAVLPAELAVAVAPGSKVYSIDFGAENLGTFAITDLALLSDKAYIWLHVTEAVDRHKIAFGRRARRLVAELLSRFSALFCHCNSASAEAWISSVGGIKVGESLGMPLYSIERRA